MTTYKSYAEAKIANPDSEIVTTSKNWVYDKELIGTFQPRVTEGCSHSINDYSWPICNPADYCSTLKEFLEAGFKLARGDVVMTLNCSISKIKDDSVDTWNHCGDNDNGFFILSAAALNGGCNIPDKAEQWTIYNNVTPMCELTDEQYGKMRRAHDSGSLVEFANVTNGFEFEVIDNPRWCKDQVYRIKPKSERELFIEASMQLMTSETERTMEQMFGAQFDAGARYTDNTQHFGESV